MSGKHGSFALPTPAHWRTLRRDINLQKDATMCKDESQKFKKMAGKVTKNTLQSAAAFRKRASVVSRGS